MSAFLDTLSAQAPDPDHPRITLAVPVKDPDDRMFTACLQSLLRQPFLPYCEILVLDSSARPVPAFEAFRGIIRVAPLTRRYLSGARQDILDQARGEAIAGIDVDCVAEPGWLAALVAPLDRERGIAASVGHNLPAAHTKASDWFQDAYEDWGRHVSAPIGKTRYMFTIDMKNYAVYTDIAREIGFDDNLKATEDHDLATRLRRKGYHIVYAPGAEIRHRNRETFPGLLRQQAWHGFGYGQNVAKNDFDIHCQRPFYHLVKQGIFLVIFPLFVLKLLKVSMQAGWTWRAVKAYLTAWAVDCRFKMGVLRGMRHQGGWRYIAKRFLSDVFSVCWETTITRL